MVKRSLFARAAAWFCCAGFVMVSASCQKIIGIEDLVACDACYSGPPATKEVGACKSGCPGDGGVCTGEVLPTIEDCSTPTIDENCDGKEACTGDVVWSVGGISPEEPDPSEPGPTTYLTLDGNQDVLVVGSSFESLQIGKLPPSVSPNRSVAYAGKLSRDDGTAAFVMVFGASGADAVTIGSDIAALPNDRAVIGGYYSGDFTNVIGGAPKTDGESAYLVEIDTKHGAVRKGTGVAFAAKDPANGPDLSFVHIFSVATLPAGDIFACGELLGTMVFPDGSTQTSAGYDAFVVHVDPEKKVVAKKFFGGDGSDYCESIRVGPKGEIAIAGTYGSSDFTIGKKLPPSRVGANIFVAVLDDSLEPQWSVGLVGGDSDGLDQDVAGVAFDPTTGNVILGGYFSTSLELGNQGFETPGTTDLFVASFNPHGEKNWFKPFGDRASQEMNGISVDGAGQILVAGSFAGRLHVDACDITSAGGDDIRDSDAFVLKLLGNGKGVWCKRGGTKLFGEGATSVVADSLGNVFASSAFPGNTFAYQGGATSTCPTPGCVTGFNYTRFDP